MLEKAKELEKKPYTYDSNGNFLFLDKINNDTLPRNDHLMPYKFLLSEQELKLIELNRKKNKESLTFRLNKNTNKSEKLYTLPK